jgi:hypothetical protein
MRYRTRGVSFRVLAAGASLLFIPQALRAAITPVGTELTVSAPGVYGTAPAVAVAPSGNFMVVWQQYTDAVDGWDVFGRRYDAAGSPLESPVRVHSSGIGCQMAPAIAADRSGVYTIAWHGCASAACSGPERVMFRRFPASGSPGAAEAAVDTAPTGIQRNPAVAASSQTGGEFLVAWQGRGDAADTSGWGVFARAYTSAGSPAGATVLVNQATSGSQHSPGVTFSIASTPGFVVAWQSQGQDASGAGVYRRRFGLTGAAIGSEAVVNVVTSGSQRRPQVSSDASGNAVVLWESQSLIGQSSVWSRRFRADGTAVGGEVSVSSAALDRGPAVASGLDGDFLAAWARTAPDGEIDLLRRGFSHLSAGETEQLATVATNGLQHSPAAAAGGPSQVVLAWTNATTGQPPTIVARRLAVSAFDFFTVTPCRLVDTRNPNGPAGGPILSSGVPRTFVLAGSACSIPATARALSINVTVTGSAASGGVAVWLADAPNPGTSTINYSAGQTRANNAVLALSRDGTGALLASVIGGNTHLIVDVNGYFE